MNHIDNYLSEVIEVTKALSKEDIINTINIIKNVKADKGRLFFVGVGGSAANASHAVNDFRKIAGIESYTPTDNVSELTARINDNGWDSSIRDWLVTSNINNKDCLFVLSVGGGNEERNVSVNLINAIKYFKEKKAKVVGIVGRDGGFTRKNADASILIPVINNKSVTTHSEAFQAIIWHLIVSHPDIQAFAMKWESTK
jgi:D-sedoheptulose 7-phosphate isomerase